MLLYLKLIWILLILTLQQIMGFLEKQSMLFVETADFLSRMARETLVHARLPNFHIPAAVEVLTTGTYNRLPNCIRVRKSSTFEVSCYVGVHFSLYIFNYLIFCLLQEKIVPADPISPSEKKFVLSKLNQVILHRLVTTELPSQMRNIRVRFIISKAFNSFLLH